MTAESLPTGVRGQALAAALTVLALAALWLGMAVPLQGWFAARQERLEEMQARTQRMESLVASLPALRRRAEAAAAEPARTGLVEGATDALAAAALQAALEAMAQRAGTSLASTETLAAAPAGGVRAIGVRATVRAPWPQFVALLRQIEEAPTRMVVDDLHLQSVLPVPRNDDVPMEASFAVTAFRAAAAGARP